MPVKVTIDGKSWLTEDLTLDELVAIEGEIGESWEQALWAPLKSAIHGRAVLTRFLARSYSDDDAAKRAGNMTMRQCLDAFEAVPDDRPTIHEDGIPVVDPKADTAEPGMT